MARKWGCVLRKHGIRGIGVGGKKFFLNWKNGVFKKILVLN